MDRRCMLSAGHPDGKRTIVGGFEAPRHELPSEPGGDDGARGLADPDTLLRIPRQRPDGRRERSRVTFGDDHSGASVIDHRADAAG